MAPLLRITGALLCARCHLVMRDVTIHELPMTCPACGQALITEDRPLAFERRSTLIDLLDGELITDPDPRD